MARLRCKNMGAKLAWVLGAWLLGSVFAQLPPADGPTPDLLRVSIDEQENRLWQAGGPGKMVQPNERANASAKMMEVLRKQNELVDEYNRKTNTKTTDQNLDRQIRNAALMAVLGDEGSKRSLEAVAKSPNPEHAFYGRSALLLRDWWQGAGDPDAQEKVFERAKELVRSGPKSESLARVINMMREHAPSTPDLQQRCDQILLKDLTSDFAQNYRTAPRIDHPFAFQTLTVNNQALDSTRLKGKVLLVHFWSPTWQNGKRDLEVLNKLHSIHKAAGLEIIGVAHESRPENVAAFLTSKTEVAMPWTHCYDLKRKEWNPLAERFRTGMTPWTVVIDRDGILRLNSSDGGNVIDAIVEKVMAERPGDSTKRIAEQAEQEKKRVLAESLRIKTEFNAKKAAASQPAKP